MDVETGPEHEKLVNELVALLDRVQMSRDERLVIMAAIQMVEYLPRYRDSISMDDYTSLPPDEQKRWDQRIAAMPPRTSRVRFTFEDWEQLICGHGFELLDGMLVPRH